MPAAEIPPGVPVVHLRSASLGTFIYQKMIDRVVGQPEDGDLVAVADKRGRFFGWGFYNSHSQIVLRILSHDTARPDDAELARRVARAVALRRDVLKIPDVTDAYRLIHAEGDGLSGLVADRFGPYVVIELFSLGMFRRLEAIQDAIVDAGLGVEQFIVRADKTVAQQEGMRIEQLRGNKDVAVTIHENGVRFAVRMARGHKTGFFCDQRDNRLALTTFTAGQRVLDVCCYTGGFSCYAARLGAASAVTAVDLDEVALATAEENARLNEVTVDFHHADAFEFLRQAQQAQRRWDVVVVDPSKFVPRRSALELGLRKYADLNRLAAGVVAPGGILLTCSCSGLVDQPTFVDTVGRAARAAGRTMQIFRLTGAGGDHPILADTPESLYLKAVWARLD
jgi:23S rRNA (cytosine1962-C5)-methyltransferase